MHLDSEGANPEMHLELSICISSAQLNATLILLDTGQPACKIYGCKVSLDVRFWCVPIMPSYTWFIGYNPDERSAACKVNFRTKRRPYKRAAVYFPHALLSQHCFHQIMKKIPQSPICTLIHLVAGLPGKGRERNKSNEYV